VAKVKHIGTVGERGKKFLKLFDQLTYSRSAWQVWEDLMTVMACSICNAVDRRKEPYEKREKEYERAIKALGGVDIPAQMLGEVVMALEENPNQDFLGQLYMNLNLGSHWHGQFFTPYHICGLMAKLNIGEGCQKEIEEKGYVSVCDPCVGAGAMLIAAAAAFREYKVNYHTSVLFIGQDIDSVVAKMAYIQISLDDVRHNRTVRCPYCNKFLLAKSEGMSRQSLVSVRWSVLVQPHNEEVLTRYFCHTKDFRIDFHNPKITTHEGYRTVHSADKVMDYMWAKYKTTGDMRWCYYRDRGSLWYPLAETVAPRSVIMYNDNLQEAVTGTCMKYSVPDIFIQNIANDERYFNSPWFVDNYFNSYRKYPFIEQLLKVGFYRMIRDFLEDRQSAHVNLNEGQNSILGTLGINKNQYNMLRKVGDPTLKDLEILRYKPDLKWNDFEELRWIRDVGYVDSYKYYIDLMRYTTLHKLRRYISEQKITYAHDYFDYTGWLEKMGYDMRNEFNLFPKNFEKAHDEMSKQYTKFKDKQAREDVKRFNRLLKKLKKETAEVAAMNLNIDGLFIRLPNKLEELKEEGESLHHCVGTYMEKVEKGETMIFFIRQKAAPEKPYYTLEWHGRVIQCRGFRNCDMTPEVKAFVEIFQEKMQEYVNASRKQRKAG